MVWRWLGGDTLGMRAGILYEQRQYTIMKQYNIDKLSKEERDFLAFVKSIKGKYTEQMDRWCRLTLDVLLYMGVTFVRNYTLIEIKTSVSKGNVELTQKAHDEWFAIIAELYKTIQAERHDFKDTFMKQTKGWKMNISYNETEKNLRMQQEIIRSSWKTDM